MARIGVISGATSIAPMTCAEALARAYARSGSASAIGGYLGNSGSFDEAMSRFASKYADQNRQDHDAFAAAVADGRVEVQREA